LNVELINTGSELMLGRALSAASIPLEQQQPTE
jgi:hypothetical protein